MNTVSYRLKELRKEAGLTQSDLAEGIVNRSYISQIEKGKVQPSYKLLQAICEKLNCTINDLIAESELEGITNLEVDRELNSVEEYLEKNEYLLAEEKLKHINPESHELNNYQLGVFNFCYGEVVHQLYNIAEAENYLRKSIEHFSHKNYLKEKLKSQNHLAELLIKQNRILESFDILDQSYDEVVFNKITGIEKISLLINLGIVHGRLGEYYSAIRFLKEANDLNKSTGMFYKSGIIHMVLGLCNRRINKINDAKVTYEKAIGFLKSAEDFINLAGTYINLGILLRHTGNFNKSETYLFLAKEVYTDLNDSTGLDNAIYEICTTKTSKGEYHEAEEMALNYLKQVPKNSPIISKLYLTLGLGKKKQKLYEDAITYFKLALEKSDGVLSSKIMDYMAETYYTLKDYQNSSYYYFSTKQ
ncbi:helix-turn-helix transcriptional regulator [Bacillus sp. 2205SS5-2]|uniref:helix-turn-helix transcriptional regulator n=1 Tax=Bacillus sp. 2205SS5-2 TaxID=3109031 RepID=UPI003007DCA3